MSREEDRDQERGGHGPGGRGLGERKEGCSERGSCWEGEWK